MKSTIYLCFALSLFAQPNPKFEVASIKENVGSFGAPRFEPTRLSITHITLPDLLLWSYHFDLWQLDWRAAVPERMWYDVDAKWEDPALKDKWPEMLQALLTERFSVKSHLENRPTNLYTLQVTRPDLLAKCKATDDDIAHPRIDIFGPEVMTYRGESLNGVIWRSAGGMSGMNKIDRETGIDELYTMTIDHPSDADQDELIAAARGSFAKCGLAINTTEKPTPYLVVTSAGKLIPN